MFLFYFSILLTVISNTLYHIAQKMTPQEANPWLALAVTYGIALLVCLGLLAIAPPRDGLAAALRQVNWASILLGFAVLGLEAGFLLAYRAGWKISLAGVVANVIVGIVLLPIGLLFFRERLTPLNLVGILACIIGLVLIGQR
jgi:uncharacterized membrane protein